MAPAEIIWKARSRKIEGQSKPFIDKNLQFQIPAFEPLPPSSINYNEYNCLHSQNSSFLFQEMAALEAELNSTILEAQQTHEAWKKMQAKLLQTT